MYNPTKTRIWKDGVTPATGTIALGSNWDAEFDQLYENWNEFFNVAGNQFSIDRINANNLYSIDGDGINFAEYFGYNIDAPVTQIHINEGSSGSALLHFTNSTTGATASDGFDIGINASEQALLWNYENTDLIIGTNNTARMYVKNDGKIGHRISNPSGIFTILSNYAYNDGSGFRLQSSNDGEENLLFMSPYSTGNYASISSYKVGTGSGFKPLLLNPSGGNVGIGSTSASNPLHVQSTTSPQQRWAYDTNSYWTLAIADGGDATLAAGEATGRLNITPGASDALVYVTGSVQTTADLVIAGNYTQILKVTNTTEASAGAGSIVASGGIYSTKHLLAGLGIIPAGSLHQGAITQNDLFDALSSFIPNTNDVIKINGGAGNDAVDWLWVFSKVVRDSATQMTIYGMQHTAGTTAISHNSKVFLDGSGTIAFDWISITW